MCNHCQGHSHSPELATILVEGLADQWNKIHEPKPPSVSAKNKLKISETNICLNISFNVFFWALWTAPECQASNTWDDTQCLTAPPPNRQAQTLPFQHCCQWCCWAQELDTNSVIKDSIKVAWTWINNFWDILINWFNNAPFYAVLLCSLIFKMQVPC